MAVLQVKRVSYGVVELRESDNYGSFGSGYRYQVVVNGEIKASSNDFSTIKNDYDKRN